MDRIGIDEEICERKRDVAREKTRNGYIVTLPDCTCTCPDATHRDGGSYDLGAIGHTCKHVLKALATQVTCPLCGDELKLIEDPQLPRFVCMNWGRCDFSHPNSPIDAKLIWRLYHERSKP